jgi:hypothetical protein
MQLVGRLADGEAAVDIKNGNVAGIADVDLHGQSFGHVRSRDTFSGSKDPTYFLARAALYDGHATGQEQPRRNPTSNLELLRGDSEGSAIAESALPKLAEASRVPDKSNTAIDSHTIRMESRRTRVAPETE